MPTPEHVEALADAISKYRLERADHAFDVMCERAERVYAAIRTDPAVQDAVLAALVEGGRLVEESTNAPEWDECAGQSCHLGGLVLPDGDPWPTHIHGLARWVRKVRLVEPEWREATP